MENSNVSVSEGQTNLHSFIYFRAEKWTEWKEKEKEKEG